MFIIVPVIALMVFLCDVAQSLTNKFDKFNDDVWQLNWYLYSTEVQQVYLIFGASTQQSVNIQGYGNIICTRETLKKVNYILFAIDF